MPILTPGCQGPFDGELRLVRADNHATAIVGTAEKMCVCYPIAVRKNDDGSFAWDYTGGTPKEYDETAEIEFDDNGEPLFQDEDGNDVPASMVAILDREGREVGRLGATPKPKAASAVPSVPELAELKRRIGAFRILCEESNETDTGAAWELLDDIEDALRGLS